MTVSEEEHAKFLARIRAERAAIGRAPYIESPAGYLLLAAILDANAKKAPDPDGSGARLSPGLGYASKSRTGSQ